LDFQKKVSPSFSCAQVGGEMTWEAVGRLEVVMRCEEQGAPATESFWLHKTDGSAVQVQFGRLKRPEPGWVRLLGTAGTDGGLLCAAWARLSAGEAATARKKRALPAAADMSVLMVQVSIAGYSPVCDETTLAGIMWRAPSNARDFWLDLSYGRLSFGNDLDGDGRDDVASVRLDTAPAACEAVWPAVQEQLAALQPSRWQRRVLMLPRDFRACGWASASVGCDPLEGCALHLTACDDYPDSLTHELGHSLGLRHGAAWGALSTPSAPVLDDYEDRSTVMGYSYPAAPRRGLNAVHRLALGMRSGNALDVAPGFSGALALAALHAADTDEAPLVKVAVVATGPPPSPAYYLSFRADVVGTYEADLGQALGGQLGPSYSRVLQVHSAEPEPGRSFLHAVLRAPGESFALPQSLVTVTLDSLESSGLGARLTVASGPQCGNGLVEAPEQCDGGACCDDTCRFREASFVCRPSAGPCDLPEMCSGSGSACGPNAFAPVGLPCREASFGPCDVPDVCAAGGVCPNSYASDGAACALPACPSALSGQCLSRQCLGSCSVATSVSSSSVSPSSSSSASVTSAPGAVACGDGVCGLGEDCKSCPGDCARGLRFCCGYAGCLGRGCPATAEGVAALCKTASPPLSLLCLLGQCQ
jgi:hypothetical protein